MEEPGPTQDVLTPEKNIPNLPDVVPAPASSTLQCDVVLSSLPHSSTSPLPNKGEGTEEGIVELRTGRLWNAQDLQFRTSHEKNETSHIVFFI